MPRLPKPAYRETPRAPTYVEADRGRRSRSQSLVGLWDDARVRGSRRVEPRGEHFDIQRKMPFHRISPDVDKSIGFSDFGNRIQQTLKNTKKGTTPLITEQKLKECRRYIQPDTPLTKVLPALQGRWPGILRHLNKSG